MIKAIQIALSGMNAASRRVEASAANIANATTAGALDPADGPSPYQALTTVQSSVSAASGESLGVRSDTIPASRPFVPAYDPDSPFANEDGLIGAPNVDLATEIVNLQIGSAVYKANIKTMQVAADMQKEMLDMVDRDA